MGTWAAEAIVEIIRGAGRRPAERSVDLGFVIRTAAARAPRRVRAR